MIVGHYVEIYVNKVRSVYENRELQLIGDAHDMQLYRFLMPVNDWVLEMRWILREREILYIGICSRVLVFRSITGGIC